MDGRTYIRLHDGMPDHPKVVGLSDAAFRLYVESLCWCSRHLTDGAVTVPAMKRMGGWSPEAAKELAGADLFEPDGVTGNWLVHDYIEHQRTSDEVAEFRESKRLAGVTGNHERWHVARQITDPSCELCAIGDVSHVRSVTDGVRESHQRSQTHRKTSPTTETDTDKEERKGPPPPAPTRIPTSRRSGPRTHARSARDRHAKHGGRSSSGATSTRRSSSPRPSSSVTSAGDAEPTSSTSRTRPRGSTASATTTPTRSPPAGSSTRPRRTRTDGRPPGDPPAETRRRETVERVMDGQVPGPRRRHREPAHLTWQNTPRGPQMPGQLRVRGHPRRRRPDLGHTLHATRRNTSPRRMDTVR